MSGAINPTQREAMAMVAAQVFDRNEWPDRMA
jgi:fumarate hydratase class II